MSEVIVHVLRDALDAPEAVVAEIVDDLRAMDTYLDGASGRARRP